MLGKLSLFAILTWTSSIWTTDCSGINAASADCQTSEEPYHRDFFYIGGEYVPYGSTTQNLVSGQIYVEKLTPVGGVAHGHLLSSSLLVYLREW